MRLGGAAAPWGSQTVQGQPSPLVTTRLASRCCSVSTLLSSRHSGQKASTRRTWDEPSLIILSHEQLQDACSSTSAAQQPHAFHQGELAHEDTAQKLAAVLAEASRNGIPSSSGPAGPSHSSTSSLLHDVLRRRQQQLANGSSRRTAHRQRQPRQHQQEAAAARWHVNGGAALPQLLVASQGSTVSRNGCCCGPGSDHGSLDACQTITASSSTGDASTSTSNDTTAGMQAVATHSRGDSSVLPEQQLHKSQAREHAQLWQLTSDQHHLQPRLEPRSHHQHQQPWSQQHQLQEVQALQQLEHLQQDAVSVQQQQQQQQQQQPLSPQQLQLRQQKQEQAKADALQPATPAAAPSSSTWLARKLTADIKQCSSWRALEALLDSTNPEVLNHIHVSAMFTCTTRVVRYHALPAAEQEHFHGFYCRLLDLAFEQLGRGAGPREAANQLWAVAKLGLHPGSEWLDAYLLAGLGLVAGFRSQEVGTVAWALAKFGHAPQQEWADAFLERARQQMRWLDGQALSNLLWAMATLGLAPPDGAWSDNLSGALVECAEAMQPQGLANSMWALARMGLPSSGSSSGAAAMPGSAAFDAIVQAAAERPRAFRPGEAAMFLHGCARLRLALPQALCSELQGLTVHALGALSYAQAANMLWALAVAGQAPSPEWLQACLGHLASRVGSADGQALGNTLHALARLGHRPEQQWWDAVLGHIAAAAGSFDSRALVSTCICLAKLGARPQAEVLQALQQATAHIMASFNSQELANVAYGMAGMQGAPPPPGAWCLQLEAAALRRMPAAKPQEVANIALALARMKHHPGPCYVDALAQYVSANAERLQAIDREQLRRAMQSLAARAARAAASTAAHAAVAAAVGAGAGCANVSSKHLTGRGGSSSCHVSIAEVSSSDCDSVRALHV